MNFRSKQTFIQWFTLFGLLLSTIVHAQLDVSGGASPGDPCLSSIHPDWSCVVHKNSDDRLFIGHGQIRALDGNFSFSSAATSPTKLSTVLINYIYHFRVGAYDRLPEDAFALGAEINFTVYRINYSGQEQPYFSSSLIIHPTDFYFGEANTQISLPPGTYIVRTTHEEKSLQVGEDTYVLSENAHFAYHRFTVKNNQ